MSIPKPFPNIPLDYKGNDGNPAIQLFGRRFFTDQTVLEYLVEFLLVGHSGKQLEGRDELFDTFLPPWHLLQEWVYQELKYLPPIRLTLKLFAFLGASKLETRHISHREQYRKLLKKLEEIIHTDGTRKANEVLKTFENLFLGFQGVGSNRTWCAQTFFPLAKAFLNQETIWNQTVAQQKHLELCWEDVVVNFKKYFSASRHRFLARGGELLYLQICNALHENGDELKEFLEEFPLEREERDPEALHKALEKHLWRITDQTPQALDRIAELIDIADGFTAKQLKKTNDWVSCGWCPQESRPEGYLFAVELLRLCRAGLDPVERIELISIGCALQVLRSLCAQSTRYAPLSDENRMFGGGLGYAWIVSDPDGEESLLKQLSQRNLQIVQRVILQALRHEDIRKNTELKVSKASSKLYKEAETKYGHKLFLSLAKRIGLVVPQRGAGARFVFNDKILRYLVLALVPPGQRVTYDDFRSALYAHYGIALEGGELERAVVWSELPRLSSSAVLRGAWLAERLRASGFLVHLSDACSLVHNPFGIDESVTLAL